MPHASTNPSRVVPRPPRHPDDAIPYAASAIRDASPRTSGSLGGAATRAAQIRDRARGIADEARELENALVGSRPEPGGKDARAGIPVAECYVSRLGEDLDGIDYALSEMLLSIGRIRAEL